MSIASQTATLASAPRAALSLRQIKDLAFPHVWLWVAVLTLFAGNSLWLGANPRISIVSSWYLLSILPAMGALALILFRACRAASYDWFLHRLWCLLLTVLLATMLMENLRVFNHLTMTLPFPFADALLLSWDRALGFDWLAYAKAMTGTPLLTKLLFLAYNGMTVQGVIAVAAVAVWLDLRKRVIEVGFLMVSSAVVCVGIAGAFPARAAMDMLSDPELLSRLSIGSGVYHLEQLFALRGDDLLVMQPEIMQGLATFPSYHTCLGLIVLWCSRGHWLTGTIGAAVGIAILAATPIYGGHYLVDLMAGGCVSLALVLLWRRYIEPNLESHMPGVAAKDFAFPGWLSLTKLKRA